MDPYDDLSLSLCVIFTMSSLKGAPWFCGCAYFPLRAACLLSYGKKYTCLSLCCYLISIVNIKMCVESVFLCQRVARIMRTCVCVHLITLLSVRGRWVPSRGSGSTLEALSVKHTPIYRTVMSAGSISLHLFLSFFPWAAQEKDLSGCGVISCI